MPNISMLDIETLRQTKLWPYIDKCLQNRAPDPGFHAIMGHNLDLCEAMFVAWDTLFNTGRIDHKLKEVIRVQLSRKAASEGLDEEKISAGCDDYERSPRFTEAERWALRYAEQMYLDPTSVDAAFYDGMKKHYSEAAIMELGAFIAFHYGMQVFMGTLARAAPE